MKVLLGGESIHFCFDSPLASPASEANWKTPPLRATKTFDRLVTPSVGAEVTAGARRSKADESAAILNVTQSGKPLCL